VRVKRGRVRVRVRDEARAQPDVRVRVGTELQGRVWVWVRAKGRVRVEGYRRGLSFEDCVVGVRVGVWIGTELQAVSFSMETFHEALSLWARRHEHAHTWPRACQRRLSMCQQPHAYRGQGMSPCWIRACRSHGMSTRCSPARTIFWKTAS